MVRLDSTYVLCDPRIHLNLFGNKAIDITFTLQCGKTIQNYKFEIPLAQMEAIREVTIDESTKVLVFSLDSPPKFYRRGEDIRSSHDPTRSEWTEKQIWLRQTDINSRDGLATRMQLPISLHNTQTVVDLGM